MSKGAAYTLNLSRTRSSTPGIDKYAVLALLACVYPIIDPLISAGGSPGQINLANLQNAEPGIAGRIFIPAIAAVTLAIALLNYSRLAKVSWPSHMVCLFAYTALAGASVLWAFRPEASFVRFAQQIMVLSSIIVPAVLATQKADLMRGMFLCFAVGAILNIAIGYETPGGYGGYFGSKNELGAISGISILLAFHETLYPGLRRVFGVIIVAAATLLLFWSHSKTPFALALISPLLAGVLWGIRRVARISPGIIFVFALLCYAAVSSVSSLNIDAVTALIYGDATFTDRTAIWDFASSEIAHRPVFGWGYRSFWLVGADAPSVLEAPGWVATMPNAHNGYYDTLLDLGYIGLGLLFVFVVATLHALGPVIDRSRGRAWLLLSLALYVMIHNCLETSWMQGNNALWTVFVIVAVEIGRCSQAFLPAVAQAQVKFGLARSERSRLPP